jgi:hypothetical protein
MYFSCSYPKKASGHSYNIQKKTIGFFHEKSAVLNHEKDKKKSGSVKTVYKSVDKSSFRAVIG